MVTYLQRPGNQAQMSMFTTARRPDDVLVRKVLDHIAANLDSDLNTAAMAAAVGVSVRHLRRLFSGQLDEAPAETVRRIRLEVAAQLLSTSDLPLSQVACRCGFSSAELSCQGFASRYGIAPSRFRSAHSATTALRTAHAST